MRALFVPKMGLLEGVIDRKGKNLAGKNKNVLWGKNTPEKFY